MSTVGAFHPGVLEPEFQTLIAPYFRTIGAHLSPPDFLEADEAVQQTIVIIGVHFNSIMFIMHREITDLNMIRL